MQSISKSSMNVKVIKTHSESHNLRKDELDYTFKELEKNNESWIAESTTDRLKTIKEYCKEKSGRKMQTNAEPIREAVVNLKPDTTMDDVKKMCDRLKKELKIEAFQIHIHRDEGKSKDNLNYHAHVVFDYQDKQKGTVLRLSKGDLYKMQDIVAESLGMERGKTSNKEHLSALEYKSKMEAEKLSVLMTKTTQLENNIKELRTAFEVERDEYVQKVHEFNRTKEHYEAEVRSFKKSLEPLKIEAQNEAKKIIEDAKKAVDSVDFRLAEAINQKFNRSPTFYMDPQKIIKEMPEIKIDPPKAERGFLMGTIEPKEHDRVINEVMKQLDEGLSAWKKAFTLQIIEASQIVGKELQQIADYRYAENAKKEWGLRNERLLQEARNQGINKEKGKGNEMGR